MSDAEDADVALDAYPPEIAALLADARPIERAPDAARTAVKAKVLATVGAANGAGTASAASAKVAPASTWWAAIAAMGVLTAVVLIALRARPAPTTHAPESAPIEAIADARSAVHSAIEAPPVQPSLVATADARAPTSTGDDHAHAATDAAAPAQHPARVSNAEDSLAEEQRLLDQARAALTDGAADRALGALSQHARRYAHGVLSMEREALRVRALVAADRRDAARATAERFVARWPSSALRSAVEAMVR